MSLVNTLNITHEIQFLLSLHKKGTKMRLTREAETRQIKRIVSIITHCPVNNRVAPVFVALPCHFFAIISPSGP